MYQRIRISVQSKKVDLRLCVRTAIHCVIAPLGMITKLHTWPVGVFVGIKKDIRSVVFVITASSARSGTGNDWVYYSLAHRYGCNAMIFGLAQVDKLKGDTWFFMVG